MCDELVPLAPLSMLILELSIRAPYAKDSLTDASLFPLLEQVLDRLMELQDLTRALSDRPLAD